MIHIVHLSHMKELKQDNIAHRIGCKVVYQILMSMMMNMVLGHRMVQVSMREGLMVCKMMRHRNHRGKRVKEMMSSWMGWVLVRRMMGLVLGICSFGMRDKLMSVYCRWWGMCCNCHHRMMMREQNRMMGMMSIWDIWKCMNHRKSDQRLGCMKGKRVSSQSKSKIWVMVHKMMRRVSSNGNRPSRRVWMSNQIHRMRRVYSSWGMKMDHGHNQSDRQRV